MSYPRLSEMIYYERNRLRCRDEWLALAVELEKTVERLTLRADAAEAECVRLLKERTDVSLRNEAKRLREQLDEARALVRDAARIRPNMILWRDGHEAINRWRAEEAAERGEGR